MVNEQIVRSVNTIKTTTGLIVYVTLAVISLIATYPIYKVIKALPNMSNSASVTISLVFFLGVFFVLYMGTTWIYKGEMKVYGGRP